MGDLADEHISRFTSAAWGTRIPEAKIHPKTTKAAIAHQLFKIVVTLDGRQGHPAVQTNRIPGTRLIVTENADNENSYWVWASQGVTGIHKHCCKTIKEGLSIHEALSSLGRKDRSASHTTEPAEHVAPLAPVEAGTRIAWAGPDGAPQSGTVGQVRPQQDGSLVYWTEGSDGRWANVTEQQRQLARVDAGAGAISNSSAIADQKAGRTNRASPRKPRP